MEALILTPEVEADVQQLAEKTGKTPAEAIAVAVREKLRQLPDTQPRDWEKIDALIREFQNATVDRSLTDDEILGYDEDGIPEQPYLGR